jgi:hypothetical protein
MKKRLILALGSGAVLGIVCIVGASVRLGWAGNQLLIMSLWYNRLVMGLMIGLAADLEIMHGKNNWILRGALIGLVISAAYFLTAGAGDWISFLIGSVYGIIIEFVLQKSEG